MPLITRSFETGDEKETIALAERIGKNCKGGEIFALVGDLGAGKTHFTKGIGRGLGFLEKEIQSPTFVISQLHTKGRLPLVHIDLYRLDEVKELEDLGWYDFINMEGVIVVEWAEKILDQLSEKETVFVNITFTEKDNRLITIKFDSHFSYLFDWN